MNEKLSWLQLKEGNKKALESIYRLHIDDMIQYGKRFSKEDSIVQDCIQELFIYLWEKREGLSDTSNVKGYLLLSLRRRIVKALQKKAKYVSDAEPNDSDLGISEAFDELIIKNETDDENIHQLNQSLSKLSDRQREILHLKFQAGLDNHQIAETLDINYQSVRNLLSRTLKSLRNTFQLLVFLWLMGF